MILGFLDAWQQRQPAYLHTTFQTAASARDAKSPRKRVSATLALSAQRLNPQHRHTHTLTHLPSLRSPHILSPFIRARCRIMKAMSTAVTRFHRHRRPSSRTDGTRSNTLGDKCLCFHCHFHDEPLLHCTCVFGVFSRLLQVKERRGGERGRRRVIAC